MANSFQAPDGKNLAVGGNNDKIGFQIPHDPLVVLLPDFFGLKYRDPVSVRKRFHGRGF